MLAFKIVDQNLLKILSYAFPENAFNTMSITWRRSGLTVEGISKERSLTARLQIPAGSLVDYSFDEEGALSVFCEEIKKVLDFALAGRPQDPKVETTWRMESKRLRLGVSVQGLGSLARTLYHLPDALLPPMRRPEFGRAARFVTKSPVLFKEIYNAIAWTELVGIKFSPKEIVFADPRSKEDSLRLGEVVAASHAETILARSSIDIISKIAEHTSPTDVEMAIIDQGFGHIACSYPKATLEYYIAAMVEPG